MSLLRGLKLFQDGKGVYRERTSSDRESEETLLKEDSTTNILLPPQTPSILHRVAVISGRIVIILLSIWGVISLYNTTAYYISQSYQPTERFAPSLYPSCSCGGTTVAEAKRRGCIFTPLAISWLPPHCVDSKYLRACFIVTYLLNI
ncbi:hypothetical protein F4819DRAFT_460702 [Hypoxylon fuscum]|nr:hypothetical protein F4819DRAFT_460702 [Hypoxylon fuscum]